MVKDIIMLFLFIKDIFIIDVCEKIIIFGLIMDDFEMGMYIFDDGYEYYCREIIFVEFY